MAISDPHPELAPTYSSSEKHRSEKDDGIEVASEVDLSRVISNPGGAPTETVSALGRHVGWFSVLFLNINNIIGTGVFSTPGSLLKGLGSPGLVLVFWLIGIVISYAGLALYLELASMFPKRGGAEVVYLEQAYRRPKYFFPAAFAAITVILEFSASNSIVLANYLLYAAGNDAPTEWLTRGVAVAGYTVASVLVLSSTKWSLRFADLVGFLKTVTLVFISITGFVVLGGHTRVKDPHANFHDSFKGSTSSGNAIHCIQTPLIANALVKINFAFSGYSNSINLINEIENPIPTAQSASSAALGLVSVLYVLANVAYFAAVPAATIKTSGTLVAGLFFTNVFGRHAGARVFPALVSLSAFGNLIAVLQGQSRVIREIARQGILPYPAIWVSTRPFGTPLVPVLLKWLSTVIVIIAPPASDAFAIPYPRRAVVDLQSYPANVFSFATAVAVFILRRRRNLEGFPRHEYHAWNIALVFSCLVNVFLLVMPWYPPAGGRDGGDVSFWYATYCAVGLGILAVAFLYWALWIIAIPKLRGYKLVEETIVLPDGSVYNHLIKVFY
ncbi:amino acid/polyamine transporter I [Mycena metata]|uniref:Amino acid/polyamine transporter I n=1 Tax=Mycena metata TaxID=1033252 RepID=A0AAD7J307_9AGAR|nr:amino acid/polyamine transporter I [Mycena metata]